MIDWDKIDLELKQKTKILLYHGIADRPLPISMAERTYEDIKKRGLEFTLEKEEGLKHETSEAELKKVSAFLHSVMQ